MLLHSIAPIYDESSTVLILGSFPSVRSREVGFFYGHPQNRFWRVLACLYNEPLPETTDEKRALLLKHHIALWDVVACCEIQGSADSTLRHVTVNDLSPILSSAPIRQIFVNGKTAEKYYNKLIKPIIGRPVIILPSTSPANASWSLTRLVGAWRVIQETNTARET